MKTPILALAFTALAASPALAMSQAEVNAALRGNAEIYNGLFTAGLIKQITDVCPDVQAPGRMQRTTFFLGLYNQARRMGYDRQQIEAFVEDKTEQEHLRGLVLDHLKREGVSDPNNQEAVCAYAKGQIAARTTLGRRLRER